MFPLRDSERSQGTPFVTVALILANLLAFFYEISLDEYSLNHFLAQWGTVPRNFALVDVFASMFLHGGWMHVLGNVWFLWIFGDNVEDILGPLKFLFFYLFCGLAGGLAHVFFNPDSAVPAIGASGAISGVMGAYLISFPKARVHTLLFLFVFATTMEVPAIFMIGFWFLVQLFSGFGSLAASATQKGGTAWFAHIGGFVAGMILIRLLRTRPNWRIRQESKW